MPKEPLKQIHSIATTGAKSLPLQHLNIASGLTQVGFWVAYGNNSLTSATDSCL